MRLSANILIGTFYSNAVNAAVSSQMTLASSMLNNIPFTSYRFNIEKDGRIDLKPSNFNDYYKKSMPMYRVSNFVSTLQSTISKGIELMNSIKNYSKKDSGKCKPDADVAILNWINHTFGPSNSVDFKLFRKLKAHLKKSIMPLYDELKSVVLNNDYKDVLPLFESYTLLTKELRVLENYFRKHPNLSANESHEIFINLTLSSYQRYREILSYFEKNLAEFEENPDYFDMFSIKIFFLLESERKANLKAIKKSLKRNSSKLVYKKKDILPVFSNINNEFLNTDLGNKFYLQIKKIKDLKESDISNSLFKVPYAESSLYYLDLELKSPLNETESLTEQTNMRDFFYNSQENGSFSIRRVDVDPMDRFSNEIVFKDFNSEFTSKPVMIFYEIDLEADKKYYWIVSSAFNSLDTKELIFVKSSDFFSNLTYFKEFFNYYLSGLKYMHSKQISNLVPRIGANHLLLGLSVNDSPFDLTTARIGSLEFGNRIKTDYEIFFNILATFSKNIKDEDSNELKCFIKNISEKAYEYAQEHGVTIKVLEDPSEWSFNCLYYAMMSRFSN